MSSSTQKKTHSIQNQASDAVATIQQVAKTLPLDNVSPTEAKAAQTASRVPVAVMNIALGILTENPDRFREFDAEAIRSAIDYEQAMAPLATAVSTLARRILRNIRKRRGTAANQSLALYQTLKGLSRLTANDPLETEIGEMEKLLTTTPKGTSTRLTKKEAAANNRKAKKAKVAAAKRAEASAADDAAKEAEKAAGIDETPAGDPQTEPGTKPAPPPAS
jgi:hypothetical protein